MLERETGFEPATSTLARSHSTTELFPPEPSKYHTAGVGIKHRPPAGMRTLLDKGPEKLLDTLQDMPRLGFIRATNGGLGYDLRYALKEKGEDGGERIVLATDRRIGFWEASHQPRSIDYPFTVIEMHLNADGEGEGKLSLATKITLEKDSKTIVLEDYGNQPVLLTSVKRERHSQ